jgi:hypothetical protein
MNSKRPLPGNGKQAYNGGASSASGGGPKRFRGDTEDEPSFEEELMMMDNMLVDMIDDGGESEVTTEQLEARWSRPPVPEAEDLTSEPLGTTTLRSSKY